MGCSDASTSPPHPEPASHHSCELALFAAGVAHELGNPLAGISACLARIRARPEDVDRTREYVSAMQDSVAHMEQVVADLANCVHAMADHQRAVLRLDDPVSEALSVVTAEAAERRIELRHLTDADAVVRGNPTQLRQVVLNLVRNALDATAAGGGIMVIVARKGDVAQLRVSDSGAGVQSTDLPHIFDPFFTTKQIGRGTGLGLTVVTRVVAEHGGTLDFQSEPGQGCTVVVSLPAAPEV